MATLPGSFGSSLLANSIDPAGELLVGLPQAPDQLPAASTVKAGQLDYRRRNGVQASLTGISTDQATMAWLARDQSPWMSTGGLISVTFPSMPQVIELARQAEFQVATIYMSPDGVHRYTGTKPMEIPLSFVLSIHDHEYATHGALTLIATAAKLHAFVLPISTNPGLLTGHLVGAAYQAPVRPATSTIAPNGANTDATGQQVVTAQSAASQDPSGEATQEQTSISQGSFQGGEESTYPPIPAWLNLISDGRDNSVSLGVNCVGYISSVRTRLKGPWLRPPTPNGMNMPSLLECDLTFVHYPGYSNSFHQNVSDVPILVRSAYANDVRDHFYNTLNLTAESVRQGGSFSHGLAES